MNTVDSTLPPPKKKSSGKAYLITLLLGLIAGAIGAVMLMRAWQARQDHFPDALMTMQAHHMGALKKNLEQNRCAPTDTIPHLQTLRRTGDDLETAFPDLAKDERFAKHASDFRAVLDASLASPPMNCEGVKTVLANAGGQCKACHDNFKKD